jgi:hypothetical protein
LKSSLPISSAWENGFKKMWGGRDWAWVWMSRKDTQVFGRELPIERSPHISHCGWNNRLVLLYAGSPRWGWGCWELTLYWTLCWVLYIGYLTAPFPWYPFSR